VSALLRIAIGWHFLYEGFVKLLDPKWTAAGFLESSTSPCAGFFRWLAADPTILKTVDLLNVWGLTLIGACLMLGLLTRLSAVLGIVLLGLYYAAYPPLFGSAPAPAAEGHYLIVDKNLVELLALGVIVVFPAKVLGLDGLLSGFWRRRRRASKKLTDDAPGAEPAAGVRGRRRVLASLTGIPFAGAFAAALLEKHVWKSFEEAQLDTISGATRKFAWSKLKDLKKQPLPTGKIGDLELSRVILGGNLIGGWAHARDLIYVSKLVKAYHTKSKIFETFHLAEACGVNTILTNPLLCAVIKEYRRTEGGKIKFISDCGGAERDLLKMAQKSIDNGAAACYVHGGIADALIIRKDFDTIAKALDLIRKNGLPAGIGGHKLATIQGCVDEGLKPDFWMKTLHKTDYWSAEPKHEHDNIWCRKPDETIAFMAKLEEPWIAFKTLAAGAIVPYTGFKYAFENGADFVCVGMYDFQIVDDVNIALKVLDTKLDRKRAWYA